MIHRTETHIDEDWFRELMAGAHPHEKARLVYHAFCALVDVEQVEQDECTDWLAQHLTGHDSAATFLETADKLRATITINGRRQPDCPYCNDGPYGNEGDPCPACGSGGIAEQAAKATPPTNPANSSTKLVDAGEGGGDE
jgi:hypothetical protein